MHEEGMLVDQPAAQSPAEKVPPPSGRTDNPAVRVLTAEGVGPMRELLAVFGRAFEEESTYLDAQPSDDYLRQLLGSECFIALVWMVEGEVVGGLAGYELRKFEQERSEIYVYDLAVAEEHRRQGVATGLLNELTRIARDRGAWVVFLQADLGDDPAMALYAKLGVREDVVQYDIAVT